MPIDALSADVWIWVIFSAVIVGFLALDLFVFHRDAHVVSMREAFTWCGIWASLGLGFGGLLYFWRGATPAGEYLAGYLIELSLSMDNVFVFAMLFTYFAVPVAYQHRVLFWGVVGAVFFRAIFIGLGAFLLEQFHFMLYIFGALLVFTGFKMARGGDHEVHPERNPVLRLVARVVPMTSHYHGPSFFVREGPRLMATPLFAVLLVVETTDILFAIDSVPAIFAVTRDPFLVFTSNAFAILGLRTLYFVLSGMIARFKYLQLGLGVLLVFVGAKMLLSDIYHVDTWVSLGVIVGILAVSVVVSLWVTRDEPRQSINPTDETPIPAGTPDAPADLPVFVPAGEKDASESTKH